MVEAYPSHHWAALQGFRLQGFRLQGFRLLGLPLLVLALVAVVGCGAAPAKPIGPDATRPVAPLSVLIEGLCPKLKVYDTSGKLFVVYGSYGLDEVAFGLDARRPPEVMAAQSFVELVGNELTRQPALLAGLPTGPKGYLVGDVEIGGHWPEAAWLARIDTRRGRSARVLYERRRRYYAWTPSGWRRQDDARDVATFGQVAPKLPEAELCQHLGEGLRFSSYAAERTPAGDALVAGRCEDRLHRAKGGVRIASFAAGKTSWRIFQAPASPLFDKIVNLGIVFVGKTDAYLYAYPPYEIGESPAYLVRFDGAVWSPVAVPFAGPIVSLAADAKGTLWAVARWRELWQKVKSGAWRRLAMPQPVFVDPPVHRMRLLELQVAAGALWLHAAYPVALSDAERSAARGHVLFTSRQVAAPTYCDRRRPVDEALASEGPRLRGAEELR